METKDTGETDVMQRCWKVGSLPRIIQALSLFLVLTLTKTKLQPNLTKKNRISAFTFFHLCICLELEGKLGNR